jgi:hypothetical protein
MKTQTVNGYDIAGNDYTAIAISQRNPRDTYTFGLWTFHTHGEDIGAFDQAIIFAEES